MAEAPPDKGERVAKLIARAGLCSRREAEAWIAAGRVSLDGERLQSPGVSIADPARLRVDGRPLPAVEAPRLWRYHKPRGRLTADSDPRGRPLYRDDLPPELPRVMPVGRLDFGSEGLLLLTNDGALKRRLELPATGWTRRYRVRVHGHPDPAQLARLAEGLTVEGVRYGPIQASLEEPRGARGRGANRWLTMALNEGKNREIRRICAHLGLEVNRLIRVSYGPFQLGNLPAGAVIEVPPKVLREQMGLGGPTAPGSGFAKPKEQRPRSRLKSRAKPRPKAKPRQFGDSHAHRRRPS